MRQAKLASRFERKDTQRVSVRSLLHTGLQEVSCAVSSIPPVLPFSPLPPELAGWATAFSLRLRAAVGGCGLRARVRVGYWPEQASRDALGGGDAVPIQQALLSKLSHGPSHTRGGYESA